LTLQGPDPATDRAGIRGHPAPGVARPPRAGSVEGTARRPRRARCSGSRRTLAWRSPACYLLRLLAPTAARG